MLRLTIVKLKYVFPILTIVLLASGAQANQPIIYQETGSFRQVEPYELEVKINDKVTTYSIPQSCGDLARQRGDVETVYGSMVEIRDLVATFSICSRYLLMMQASLNPKWDYVSSLDYLNMPIYKLPYEFSCLGIMNAEGDEKCNAATEHQLFAFTDYFGNRAKKVSYSENCRLVGGEFAISASALELPTAPPEGNVSCVLAGVDEIGYGFLLTSVSFADINKDNYMDAIVSVVELGPHSGTFSRTFILTRFHSGDWFKIIKVPPPAQKTTLTISSH